MAAAVAFSKEARRMLDDADERWIGEHGYLAANPLVEQAEHAVVQLGRNPELGVRFRRAEGRRPEIRRLLLQVGWHLYYSIDSGQAHVLILAVHYAKRGGQPLL